MVPSNPDYSVILWTSYSLLETAFWLLGCCALLLGYKAWHRSFLLIFILFYLLSVLFVVLQTSTDKVPSIFSTPSRRILTYIS